MSRTAALVLIVSAFGVPGLPAQAPQAWRLAEADHFDITYTAELAQRVEAVKAEAERAYRRVSRDLQHELSLRPLLVLFATRSELERALASGTVPGNREHLLVPLDTPPAQAGGDLAHELAHVFAFDIVPSSARDDLPPWIHEGLADFVRGEWSPSDMAALGEALRTSLLPTLGDGFSTRRSRTPAWSGSSATPGSTFSSRGPVETVWGDCSLRCDTRPPVRPRPTWRLPVYPPPTSTARSAST